MSNEVREVVNRLWARAHCDRNAGTEDGLLMIHASYLLSDMKATLAESAGLQREEEK